MRACALLCALLLALSTASAARTGVEAGLLQPRSGRALLGANTYKQGDMVPLWASKVGPFSNPRCDEALS